MSTSDKIKAIQDFLSKPENKLIFSKEDHTLHSAPYFDIELSKVDKDLGFSTSIIVSDIQEAISILSAVSSKMDLDSIKKNVQEKLNSSFIDPNSNFFLIVKGNKR